MISLNYEIINLNLLSKFLFSLVVDESEDVFISSKKEEMRLFQTRGERTGRRSRLPNCTEIHAIMFVFSGGKKTKMKWNYAQ